MKFVDLKVTLTHILSIFAEYYKSVQATESRRRITECIV
jgi:hypothetical protein